LNTLLYGIELIILSGTNGSEMKIFKTLSQFHVAMALTLLVIIFYNVEANATTTSLLLYHGHKKAQPFNFPWALLPL